MELIEGVALSKLCDYSFGDQSGQWGNIFTSFMKDANLMNLEFVEKLFEIQKSRDYTPTDEHIFNAIPENVLCISAINSIAYGGKVVPAPYGLQRAMNPSDSRIDDIKSSMRFIPKNPPGLLYVSHSENTNTQRVGIKNIFKNKSWVEVHEERVPYSVFLYNLSQSKFMICPVGNAIDCHRNWEVLYMRRVPVMKTHPYLKKLFEGYPVLFVNEYTEVTEELLKDNDHLFAQAQEMDLIQLTLPTFFDNIVNKVLEGEYVSK